MNCRNHPGEPAAMWASFDSPVGAFTVWLCADCLEAAEATGTLPGRQAELAGGRRARHRKRGDAMSGPAGELVQRCANGRPCVEVTEQLEAGHGTKYVEGCAEHGEELIAQAARIAEVHRQENELREAG